MATYALAIDIGASSGRHILGHMENGEIRMEEIYRFPNQMIPKNGRLCWDIEALTGHVIAGMKKCAEIGKIPATVAVDTWGVDYLLLDKDGSIMGDAVAYRDTRTDGFTEKLNAAMPFPDMFARTGIAHQPFNTVYQLMADFATEPAHRNADKMLFMPCYLCWKLCGVAANEYTIASTGALLNADTRDWDAAVLAAAGIPAAMLGGKPAMPGTVLGPLLPEITEEVGYQCQVMLTACHDTGSAFYCVPAPDENTAYLSSGTWSLLGAVLDAPICTEEALKSGYTNEGGVNGVRFLKNIMGMWLLQRIRADWNNRLSHGEIAALAEQGADYAPVIDVFHPRFLNPESMVSAVLETLAEQGDPAPANDAQLLYCVHHSLAVSYAQAIRALEEVTGRSFTSLLVIGGGSQNQLLNRLTEQEAGVRVLKGPIEGTALGNLRVQLENIR